MVAHHTLRHGGTWSCLTVTAMLLSCAAEQFRAEKGWTDPADTPFDRPGLLKEDYSPGDIGFDPLGWGVG